MMRLVTTAEMRLLERMANENGISYEQMMECAGNALSAHLLKIAARHGCGRAVFLCGNGNNAGDCFVAARLLSCKLPVTVCLLCGEPKTELSMLKFSQMRGISVLRNAADIRAAITAADLIADGVFGIGFHGELPAEIQTYFECICGKICVAVDLPSGADGSSGAVSAGTLHCDYTVTFGAAKTGQYLDPLSAYTGEILYADIGVPASIYDAIGLRCEVLERGTIRAILPPRNRKNTHKGDFGRLLCVCGSENMTGAAVMCAEAALRCGVGTLCLASVPQVCRTLVSRQPEAMTLPLKATADGMISPENTKKITDYAKSCTAAVIGCGLGQSAKTAELVRNLLHLLKIPIILDADGLNVIASDISILRETDAPVILTPHPAEMARLCGISTAAVQDDRFVAAKLLTEQFPSLTVVLKGSGTLISAENRLFYNPTGNSGMSKGGSGDVLAGMTASFAAQGISPADAAKIAVYLHGYAGDLAAERFSRYAMLPTDLIQMLPNTFLSLEQDDK